MADMLILERRGAGWQVVSKDPDEPLRIHADEVDGPGAVRAVRSYVKGREEAEAKEWEDKAKEGRRHCQETITLDECEHDWPDELAPSVLCQRCGLRYDEWPEAV